MSLLHSDTSPKSPPPADIKELKELFGKKLLMESDMSDLEESHLRQSGLEINADFNLATLTFLLIFSYL